MLGTKVTKENTILEEAKHFAEVKVVFLLYSFCG